MRISDWSSYVCSSDLDDRTEPCIGKSLHAGRIDLRGDREAVGEALRLCHEFETFRSVVNFWSSMPTSMAATNGMACTGDRASDATAGPGHRPATPQPTPNTTAPVSRCGSRSDLSGNENVSPNTGLAMRAWNRQATAMTSTAPPITKASVGSQSPNTSRKPRTRCGSVIPDTVRPMPNRKPEASGGKSLRMSDMSGSNQRRTEEHTSELPSLNRT